MKRQPTAVAIANQQVPIAMACRLLGVSIDTDDGYGKSVKVHCPFGDVHHSDGGAEKAMRVYPDTNTAYCFAGCGHFTPVRLLSHAWDRPAAEVALDLLDQLGHRPLSLADQFAGHETWTPPPDPGQLAEALKTYCRRIDPSWDDRQFEPRVAARLSQCLRLLDRVATDDDANRWLTGAKKVMSQLLDGCQAPSVP